MVDTQRRAFEVQANGARMGPRSTPGRPLPAKAGTSPKGHIGMGFRLGTLKAVVPLQYNPEGLPTKFSVLTLEREAQKENRSKQIVG